MIEFRGFPKIARLNREIIITEKIDGTNGQIHITETGEMFPASRNKYLTETEDNHGFYKWAMGNKEELLKLGPGRHFGEWWGQGIQGRYTIKEKRFSLFREREPNKMPVCCSVVPLLAAFRTPDSILIHDTLTKLAETGSIASGIKEDRPEGIVIYHTHSGTLFKVTLENDACGKGA